MKIMDNDMNVSDHSLHPFETDYHSFFLAFPVSIILHMVVAAALILGQDFIPEKKISLPPVINVSMVSFPLQETMPDATVQNVMNTEEVAEPEPEPEPVTEPEPEEKMPEAVIPEEKPPEPEKPKEKPAEPEKPKEKPLEKPAEKPVKTIKHKKPDHRVANSKKKAKKTYKDTIERLKQKYDEEITDGGQNFFGIPTETGNPDAVIGRRDYGAIRFYRDNVIPERINKNWAFSESLTTRRFNLEAVLMIKIMPDGEITEILFKKRSGDSYFDDSAYKAVIKSSPLPPLPKGYDYYQVGLKFTPTGMN